MIRINYITQDRSSKSWVSKNDRRKKQTKWIHFGNLAITTEKSQCANIQSSFFFFIKNHVPISLIESQTVYWKCLVLYVRIHTRHAYICRFVNILFSCPKSSVNKLLHNLDFGSFELLNIHHICAFFTQNSKIMLKRKWQQRRSHAVLFFPQFPSQFCVSISWQERERELKKINIHNKMVHQVLFIAMGNFRILTQQPKK